MLLCACAGAPPPPPQTPAPAAPEPATSADSVIQVLPLTSPEATLLAVQAAEARAEGRLNEAESLLASALQIAPSDPKLWQALAELALEQGDYVAARDHARYAFEIGPQVGEICYRNWQTLERAEAGLGRSVEAAQAGHRAQRCHVRAGPRY